MTRTSESLVEHKFEGSLSAQLRLKYIYKFKINWMFSL